MNINDLKTVSKSIVEDIIAGGKNASDAAELLGNYVLMRNRETSIVDRVLAPIIISEHDVTRDPSDPENAFIEVLERESMSGMAMTIPFDGKSAPKFIRDTYYVVRYQVITSPSYKKPHSHLGMIKQDIASVVDRNIVEKIGNIKDRYFFNSTNAIFQASPSQEITAINLTAIDDPVPENGHEVEILSFDNPDLVLAAGIWQHGARNYLQLMLNQFSKNALKFGCYVMPETVFNGIYQWSYVQLGNKVGDITISGYRSVSEAKIIFDKPIITTQKNFTEVDADTGEEINTYVFGSRPRKIDIHTIYSAANRRWEDEDGNPAATSETDNHATWIYAFAEPRFLGKNGIIDKVHMYVNSGIVDQTEEPALLIKAWMWAGIGIANTRAVVRTAVPDPTL